MNAESLFLYGLYHIFLKNSAECNINLEYLPKACTMITPLKSFLLFLFLIFLLPVQGQHQQGDQLFLTLKRMDSLLFERGFNRCDIILLENIISEDLEFFHDQSGLSTTKAEFLGAIERNICSSPNSKPIRVLKEGTLEVFPLYDRDSLYGAIQKGVHEFYIKEPRKELYQTSTARFFHVWLFQNDKWLLEKVFSYEHKGTE